MTRCLLYKVDKFYNTLLYIVSMSMFASGERWKSLSPDKQKKYRDKSATLRAEYNRKKEEFLKEHPEAKLTRVRYRKHALSWAVTCR